MQLVLFYSVNMQLVLFYSVNMQLVLLILLFILAAYPLSFSIAAIIGLKKRASMVFYVVNS